MSFRSGLEAFHHRVALSVDNSGQCHDTHNSETLRMPVLPSSCGDQMSSAYFRALCNYFMHYTFLIFMECSEAVVSTCCRRDRRTDRDATTHFGTTCLAKARFYVSAIRHRSHFAVARGVPADHVFREGRALTTWQNLRFAARMMRDHDWKTVLIISTADHLPRARRIAQYYGLEDSRTGYIACDLDLPPDSDEEACGMSLDGWR